MGIHRPGYLGATASVIDTTSTGAGTAVSVPALSSISAQVVVNGTGTGSFLIEGSLNGTNWNTVISATTYANSRLVHSSTIGAVTNLRARVTAHGSTKPVTIWLTGG